MDLKKRRDDPFVGSRGSKQSCSCGKEGSDLPWRIVVAFPCVTKSRRQWTEPVLEGAKLKTTDGQQP